MLLPEDGVPARGEVALDHLGPGYGVMAGHLPNVVALGDLALLPDEGPQPPHVEEQLGQVPVRREVGLNVGVGVYDLVPVEHCGPAGV